eukprot:jgi/Ulvmu1/7891/UM004_0123.1
MVDVTGVHKRPMKQKKQQDAAQKNQLKDIPNSRLYAEMRELDLRIEQYTNRKKAEIFDLDQHHHLQTRTLRLHLYNQHFNQSGVDPNATPSWSFFIYGQFLDQDHAFRNLAPQGPEADKKVASRFWTTAMSSIEITTSDPTSDRAPIDMYRWQKNRHVGQHKEGIEIHRVGTKPVNVTVKMIRDFAPELMLVSGKLQKALGVRSGTRGFLLHKLWEYAKAHSTPEESDPAYVQADDELAELVGDKRIMLGTLGQKMDPFLSHPEPVELQYTIMLDGPSPCTPLCFDVDVAWSLRQEMLVLPPFLDRLDIKTQLLEHDRKITGKILCSISTVNLLHVLSLDWPVAPSHVLMNGGHVLQCCLSLQAELMSEWYNAKQTQSSGVAMSYERLCVLCRFQT